MCVVRTPEVYFLSRLQVHIIIILYITSTYTFPEFIHYINESLYPLINISPFFPPPPQVSIIYGYFRQLLLGRSIRLNHFKREGGNLKFFMKSHDFLIVAAAKLLQSCPTLWDPIDGSPPGSPVPGILQARTLEWVAISFSSAWKWKVKVKSLSRVRPSATPWTAAYQAPPSMGFSRQECWSGVPLPSPFNC